MDQHPTQGAVVIPDISDDLGGQLKSYADLELSKEIKRLLAVTRQE